MEEAQATPESLKPDVVFKDDTTTDPNEPQPEGPPSSSELRPTTGKNFMSPDLEPPPGDIASASLLAQFAQAKALLKETLADTSVDVPESPASSSFNDSLSSKTPTMLEDEEDVRLKKNLLKKYNPGETITTTPGKKLFASEPSVGSSSPSKGGEGAHSFWEGALGGSAKQPSAAHTNVPVEVPELFDDPEVFDDDDDLLPPEDEKHLLVSPQMDVSSKAPQTPPSPRASTGSHPFFGQEDSKKEDQQLLVSPQMDVSSKAPKTPPSPRASTGSHPFFGQEQTKEEAALSKEESAATPVTSDEKHLLVSPQMDVSSEAPTTPPSPRASTGSHPFFGQENAKKEEGQQLLVSPQMDVSPEAPKTPPSPRASTGSHPFFGQESAKEAALSKDESAATPVTSDEKHLLVSPQMDVSPEAPTTPPSPRASTGSHPFFGQEQAKEAALLKDESAATSATSDEKHLLVSPQMDVSSKAPKTPPSPRASTGSHSFFGQENAKEKDNHTSSSNTPPQSNVSKGEAVSPPSQSTPSAVGNDKTTPELVASPDKAPAAQSQTTEPSLAASASKTMSSLWSAFSSKKVAPSPSEEKPPKEQPPVQEAVTAPPIVASNVQAPVVVAAESSKSPVTRAKQEAAAPLQTSVDEDAFLPNQKSVLSKENPKPARTATTKSALPSSKSNVTARRPKAKKPSGGRPRVTSASTRTTVSTTTTSTTASSSSTVARPRKTAIAAGSSRLTRPTAASQHRAKKSPSHAARSVTPKSAPSSDDGVAKARERLKQRMEAKKAKEAAVAEAAKSRPPPTAKTSSAAALNESRARAKERVRQRQLQAQAKSQQRMSTGASNARSNGKENLKSSATRPRTPPTNSVPLHKRTTASMQARTVAKSPNLATKRQMGQKTYSSSGRRAESSRDVNPITRALGSPTHADGRAASARSFASSSGPRALTVPKGPRLSTSSRGVTPRSTQTHKVTTPAPFHLHESKHHAHENISASTSNDPPELSLPELSLAESMKLFEKKGLRGETPAASTRREPKLTVPKPFHLHESKHHTHENISTSTSNGPPDLSLAESMKLFEKKGLRGETPAASVRHESKLTVPKPFHFHDSKSAQSSPTAAAQSNAEPSLAESMQQFMKKGLRDDASVGSVKRTSKLTVPQSPKFHATHKKPQPKSTAEKEEELMEYYRKHKFRAQPLPATTSSRKRAHVPPKAPNAALTKPVPFHLRSDERGARAKSPQGSPDKEVADLEECKKKFHARPLNTKILQPLPKREPVRTVTTPKPFKLSAACKSEDALTPDEVEMKKQFHARPLPLSTYTGPKVSVASSRKKSRTDAASTISTATTPGSLAGRSLAGPPVLATSARTEKRKASQEESRRNALSVAKERERMLLQKKREKHHEEMVKASIRSPLAQTPTQPFHLRSEARHEEYQQHWEEKQSMEEAEKTRMMSFRARRVVRTAPPKKIHSERPNTEPRPFHLSSLTRHELSRQEIRHKLEEEEREREEHAHFKAAPLPLSTYEAQAFTPAPRKQLVSPHSPTLQSSRRAQQRKEFDEHAERERQEALDRKKELEERIKAEEEQEMQEKRRLPVSEGGLIPKAEPINAVFLQPQERSILGEGE